MRTGIYCNWGVSKYAGRYYIDALNLNYINVIRRHGFDVILLSKVSSQPPRPEELELLDVTVIELPWFDGYWGARFYFLEILQGLRLLLRKCEFVFVRVPEPFCWLTLFLSRFFHAKVHFHFVSDPIAVLRSYNDGFTRFLIRLICYAPEHFLSLAAASLSSSSCLGESARRRFPFFIRNRILPVIEASYAASNLPTFRSNEILRSEKIRFLTVSRLVRGKGLELLLESFAALRTAFANYEFELTVVGGGPLQSSLENLLSNLELYDHVKFVGPISFGTNLDEFFKSHDVLVSASYSETGPRCVLEAATNCMYVISTDVGYVKEVLSGDAELYCTMVRAGCIKDLVDSYLFVWNNRGVCQTRARRASQIARALTLDNFIRDIFPTRSHPLNTD